MSKKNNTNNKTKPKNNSVKEKKESKKVTHRSKATVKEDKLLFKDRVFAFLKCNWIRLLIIIIILVLIWFIVSMFTKRGTSGKYVLDPIYDVYPDDVRTLYQNILDVSCNGDMEINIPFDKQVLVKDLDKDILGTYVISYLDKNDLFQDDMKYSEFVAIEKELLNTDSDLLGKTASFQYDDYRYVHMGDKIVRQENECTPHEYENFLHLYAFTYNEDYLSVYVNYGKIKDGFIYNDNGVRLGSYSKDANLIDTLIEASYYIFKFVKDGEKYKLHSIEHLNKT